MPVIKAEQARSFALHNARFVSYLRADDGDGQLCAWRLELDAGSSGTEHTVGTSEVIAVTSGWCTATLDGIAHRIGAGDVAVVPAGARIRLDGGDEPCQAWVSVPGGFHAVLPDGSTLVPPWVSSG